MLNAKARSMFSILLLTGFSGIAGLLQPGTVQAQEQTTLEEIVVTAEKRAENAQDLSIALTVVSGDEIRKNVVTDLTGLTTIAPDLEARTDSLFTHFTIRGVGSQDNGEVGDDAITVAVDGEYINRPVALNTSLFDIERVEILRGPQGTLYGRNATAGAVSIITNKPGNEFDSSVMLDFGNYSSIMAQGMINAPVSDNFAVRGAFLYNKHDGYVDAGPAGDMDNGDLFAVRVSGLFTPSDNFTGYLAFEYNRVDQTAVAQYGVDLTGLLPPGSIPSEITFDLPDNYPLADPGSTDIDQWAVRSWLDWDLGFATLSYVGGYREVEYTGTTQLNGFVPNLFSFDNYFKIKSQSHELRLSGDTDNWQWQTGLYYGLDKSNVARGLFLPFVGELLGLPGPPFVNYFQRNDVKSSTTGLYAQATYKASDKVEFTFGARETWDDKSLNGCDVIPFTYFYPNPPTSCDVQPIIPLPDKSDSWNKATWLASVNYYVNDASMLYAKISTGYKAGGFDNIGSYDPESLVAYEIGSKNRFADNTLQLNMAAFYYDYTDQQTSVFISTEVGNQVVNAGASTNWGVEADLEWLATEHDRITIGAYYLNAQFDDLPTVENRVSAPSVPVNLAGNRPVQSPKLTLNLGYDHSWDFSAGSLVFAARGIYKSEYYTTPFNWAADKQDSYWWTDASLTWAAQSGAWDVAVYGRNLGDVRVQNFSSFNGDNINIYNWIRGAPRTYGVQFNYHWF